MSPLPASETRGILHAQEGQEFFRLDRREAGPALSAWIDHFWELSYRLPLGKTHTQTVLSFPNVHLAFEEEHGETKALLYGIPQRPFVRTIRGEGRVLGVRFRSGMFYGFGGRPVARLTGTVSSASALWGPEVDALIPSIFGPSAINPEPVRKFFEARLPLQDTEAEFTSELVALVLKDSALIRVEDLAQRAGRSVRQLQRVFHKHVGVSPKWVLRRFRLQEAAQTMENDPAVPWPDLALRLGYFDQAHFANDFKAVLGVTPGEYRRGE